MRESTGEIRRVSAGVVELAIRDSGGDGVPIVYLHGTSATLGVWDPVVAKVSGAARHIQVDQRGHGRSDAPETGYGTDQFVGDIAELQDALGLGRMLLVGHSMGARNAWVFASRHRERVAGVVAVDYAPNVDSAKLDRLASRVASGDRLFADAEEIDKYLADRYPRMPAEAVRRRRAYGYRPVPGGFRPRASPSGLEQLVAGLRADEASAFAEIDVPMTVIRGVDSDFVTDEVWTAAQALAPSHRFVESASADHYVPEEEPGFVAGEIDAIIAKLELEAIN